MKVILVLSGLAGSGKDSAAEILVDEMSFERVAFADMLKAEVSAVTKIPLETFHNNAFKDHYMEKYASTARQLLLNYAAERKLKDPDVYSRTVVEHIRQGARQRYVVSDWRYRHEYTFLKEALHGEYILIRGRIMRTSVLPREDPSEHDLDNENMDFVIVNDGSISDLRDAIKSEVRKYIL